MVLLCTPSKWPQPVTPSTLPMSCGKRLYFFDGSLLWKTKPPPKSRSSTSAPNFSWASS